jgi:hypothetical protein
LTKGANKWQEVRPDTEQIRSMARPVFSAPLCLLTENPEEVLKLLREGWIDYLASAHDQFTDLHILYGLKSGLLDACAAAFPDPRLEPEVPLRVLLAASVAGAFQGEYALSQVGCALHSAALLAELGLNIQWLQPGAGISRRGTEQEAVFHADALRKLLKQLARADREAGRPPGASLLDWWNEAVGPAFQKRAGGGVGVWLLDATKLLVNLKNPRYEGSETSKDEDGQPIRGYKLGLLSTLVDVGRLIVRLGWDGVRAGDATVTWPLVRAAPPLAPGDTLLHDRGLIDGETVTCLKRDLQVDTVFPLKRDMLAYRLAVWQARERECHWKPHPTRKKQEIQKVEEIGGPWEACQVPLNACVVREYDPEHREAAEDGYRYWVFATTNRERSAKGVLQDYETRCECEEDHRQTKGPNWEMDEFTSTSLVEILFHVLVVLFAYNLCQLYGLTEAGQRFAGKTKQARQRELRRQRERYVVVVAGPYYALLPELDVHEVLIEAEGAPRERLRAVIQRAKEGRKASKRAG